MFLRNSAAAESSFFPLSLLSFTSARKKSRAAAPRHHRLDRQAARSIDCLAHAIEYLEDTAAFHGGEATSLQALTEAVDLLKNLNRQVFRESCAGARVFSAGERTATLSVL